jgi:hypothetical protein
MTVPRDELPEAQASSPDGLKPRLDSATPRTTRLANLVALGVWTLAVVAAFKNAALLRGALFYFDITEINYPYRDFLARFLRQGQLPPRWHPGLFCGHPLFSESQAGYFHPLKLLLYPFLPTWQAFNLDSVLSVWLTGVFTFFWLRRRVYSLGALAGASIAGLGGYTWSHFVHTSMINALASVPLILWMIDLAWDTRRRWPIAVGALALAAQVFAGHLQDTILTVLLLGALAVCHVAFATTREHRSWVALSTVSLVGLGSLISAVQWIPSKELLDRSPRAGGLEWEELTFGSLSPELIPTLLVREAYGTRAMNTDWMDGFYPWQEMNIYLSVLALPLAVIGLAARRDRWTAAWILVGLSGLLLMTGRFTCFMDLWPRLPILGSARIPIRFHLWVTFAVAALAAVGIDRLSRVDLPRIDLKPAALALLTLALISIPILIAVYHPLWTNPDRWPLREHQERTRTLLFQVGFASARTATIASVGLVAAYLAARSRSVRQPTRFAAVLPLLIIVDLVASHFHDAPTVDPRYWTQTPAVAGAILDDPTYLRMVGERTYSAGEPGFVVKPIDFLPVRETLAWSLPPVFGLRSIEGATPILDRRRDWMSRIATANRARLDGLSHVVTGRPSPDRLGTGVAVGNVFLHRLPPPLPRVRFLGLWNVPSSAASAYRELTANTAAGRDYALIDPMRLTIPIPGPDQVPSTGSARLLVDEPEHLVIETESTGPGWLVVADTYDPGWTATIDGRPATIHPANLAQRGIAIPSAGSFRVEMSYTPAGFELGVGLSIVGLALGTIFLAVPRRFLFIAPSTPDQSPPLERPNMIPLAVILTCLALVIGSSMAIESGKLVFHPRWRTAFHTFTWGAGIKAMKPPRPLDLGPASTSSGAEGAG